MSTIWKFPIHDVGHPFALQAPGFGRAVHFGLDADDRLSLWAEVDPACINYIDARFVVVGTGQPLPEQSEHCGTALVYGMVWHLRRLP